LTAAGPWRKLESMTTRDQKLLAQLRRDAEGFRSAARQRNEPEPWIVATLMRAADDLERRIKENLTLGLDEGIPARRAQRASRGIGSMKNEAKHTPGPWQAKGCLVNAARGTVFIGAADSPSMPFSAGEEEANVRLIAAAPDLLEACKQMIAKVTRIPSDDMSIENMMSDVSAELERMEAAIAKAEGR
jgi:hypothetical protein